MVVVVSLLGLAAVVYRQDPQSAANRSLASMAAWASFWVICNFFEAEFASPQATKVLLRLDFASAAVTCHYICLFCLLFPLPSFRSLPLKSMTALTLAMSVLSLTPWVVKDVTPLPGRQPIIIQGPLFALYAGVIATYVFSGIYFMIRKWQKLQGLARVQASYVLMGMAITGVMGVSINLGLGAMTAVPTSVSRLGIYSLLSLTGFSTYAIIRYRLMDISLLLRDTGWYLFASAIIGFVFAGAAAFLTNDWLASAAVFAVSLTAPSLHQQITAWIRTARSRRGLMGRDAVRVKSLSDRIQQSGYKISDLGETVTQLILDELPADSCAMYTVDHDKAIFVLTARIGKEALALRLDLSDPLIQYLEKEPRVLVRAEAERFMSEEQFKAVAPAFVAMKAEVCAPLVVLGHVAGLLSVGPKKAARPYFVNEVARITEIAAETSTALRYVLAVSKAAAETKRWAHSLNQSLKPLSQGFEVLEDVDPAIHADPNRQEIYRRMKRPMKRLADFLYYLTHQARMVDESLRNNYSLAPVNLIEIVHKGLNSQKISLEKKNILVDIDMEGAKRPVHGHMRDMISVVESLTSNAVRYLPPAGRLKVRGAQLDDAYRISVENDGPVIPPQHLKDIFEEGFQIKDGREGTGGLGLANVKRIIDMHRGKIWAENAEKDGQSTGVRFTIDLPVS